MKVYLIRHGEAVEKRINPQSPLSEQGEAMAARLGRFLASLQIKPGFLIHSGKLRAQQTAEIIAKAIHFEGTLETQSGLEPMAPVSFVASQLNQADEDLMLVGHMPFMGKLTAKLITGAEGYDIVAFQTATAVCLERIERASWVIQWVLSPRLLDDYER